MKLRTGMTLLLLLAAGFSSMAQTTDEIVAKALEARGGLARLAAVQSQRITGKISFDEGIEGRFVVEFKRPGKFHMDMTLAEKKVIRIFDGKSSGWSLNPFAGDTELQPMSADDVANVREESDFDGPFIDYKAKGNQIELAGKDKVEGKDAYRIKLTTKGGEVRSYHFDATSFLLVKWEGKRKGQDGKEFDVESFFHDYRKVNGIQFAFEIVSGLPGAAPSQKIIVEKIEVDLAMDEAIFSKP